MASKSPDAAGRPAIDRLPPHSIEAEQGVLGCILLSPECLADCATLSLPHFYDLRHQELFKAIQKLDKKRIPIDLITLQRELSGNEAVELAGGLGYISSLDDAIPSAANLQYYLDIVIDKFYLRKLIQTCAEVIGRSYDYEGDIADFKFSVNSDLASAMDDGESKREVWNVTDLGEFNVDDDKNSMIGNRFLCKSHAMLVIGSTGAGKSSLVVQMGSLWAMGKPFFGASAIRPMRVLYVQAENDIGDMAEQVQGIAQNLRLDFSDAMDLWNDNFKIIPQRMLTGARFFKWLEREIETHRADIVIIDPLLNYVGIDIMRQDECSRLVSEIIDPVLVRTKAIFIATHHTAKPRNQNPKFAGADDAKYDGLGSSVLSNWPRAKMTLSAVDDLTFKLELTKRGRRARASNIDGSPTTLLWLKHAEKGIFWHQIEAPESGQNSSDKPTKRTKPERICGQNLHSFLAACPAEGESGRQLSRRLCNWLASKEAADRMGGLDETSQTIRKALAMLVEADKLTQKDRLYFKGTNA